MSVRVGFRERDAASLVAGGAILLLAALPSPTAHAAAWDAYGVLNAAGGYTDNALSTARPQPGDPDAARPEADTFAEVRPELIMVTQGPRSRIDASYAFTTQIYQSHEDANAYTNQVQLSWLNLISPQTDLRFMLTGLQGERSAFQQGGMIVGQIPNSRLRTFEARLEESIEYQFDSPWTLRQVLAGSFLKPFGEAAEAQPDSYLAEAELQMFREYPTQRWGFELATSYAVIGESRMDDVVLQLSSKFLISRALLTHRRGLTNQLDLEIGAGALQVADGNDPSIAIYEPSGRIALHYTTATQETMFGADYDHGAGASTYTGNVGLVDAVGIYMQKDLLPEREMYLETEANYAFSRIFDLVSKEVSTRADIIQVNASLRWQVEDSIILGLTGTVQRQTPREDGLVPGAPTAPDLRRNTVMLSIAGTVGASRRRQSQRGAARDQVGEQRRDIIDGATSEGGDGAR